MNLEEFFTLTDECQENILSLPISSSSSSSCFSREE
jgi:hypothetical protein